ncbi:MAG: hypothetical protein ABSE92_05005 [Terriglobales bacterium]|jgi:hypothetical protein
MGFVLDFDARNNILRVTLEDPMTDAILLDAYATAARYVASRAPCRGIWEASAVTQFKVSNDVIRVLAKSSPIIPPGYMRVVIAPHDLLYGMMRMFQILGEDTRPDLHVVRTLDEAYQLLHVRSPEFGPVS